MKKLIIPVVVIAALIIAPWVVGKKSHQEMETMLDKITEKSPGVSYEITEFNQSIFNSTGKIRFKYDESMLAANQQDAPEELSQLFTQGLVFDIDITHGPVLTKPNFGLGLSHTKFSLDTSEEPLKSFVEKAGITELLYGEVLVDLSGKGDSRSTISEFKFAEDDLNIEFGGVEAHQTFDKNLNYSGDAVVKSLSIVDDETNLSTSPITMEFQGKLEPELNWGVGKFTSTMQSVKFKEGSDGEKGEISNLSLMMDITEPTEGLFNMHYILGVGEVSGSALETPITNVNYDMTLKNVSKAAIQNMNALSLAQDPSLSPEEQAQKAQEYSKKVGEEFLKHSPSVALDALSFNYGKATFVNMNGNFGLNSAMIPDTSMIDANPMMLIPALQAQLNADFSENLVTEIMQIMSMQQMEGFELSDDDKAAMKTQQEAQAQMMIAQFIEMGYITRNDKGLATKATFENGQLLVNGNPLPFGF